MKIKGIKRGQAIELTSTINIPDGTELLFEIDDQQFFNNDQYPDSQDEFPIDETIPLTSFIGAAKGLFATPEEVDRFIRQERDAWDS